MKKLLLILMITPMLFISCNKDDDTIDNNNNNNNATATFLENQDGSVWIAQPETNPQGGSYDSWTANFHYYDNVRIGFFNDLNYMIVKEFDTENPSDMECVFWIDGTVPGNFNIPEVNIITNTPNELLLRTPPDYDQIYYEWKFTTNSNNSNQIYLEEKAVSTSTNEVYSASVFYIKSSTETNLSCN